MDPNDPNNEGRVAYELDGQDDEEGDEDMDEEDMDDDDDAGIRDLPPSTAPFTAQLPVPHHSFVLSIHISMYV